MPKVWFRLGTMLLVLVELFFTFLPILACRWIWLWIHPVDFWQKVVLLFFCCCFGLPIQGWFFVFGFSCVLATTCYLLDNWKGRHYEFFR